MVTVVSCRGFLNALVFAGVASIITVVTLPHSSAQAQPCAPRPKWTPQHQQAQGWNPVCVTSKYGPPPGARPPPRAWLCCTRWKWCRTVPYLPPSCDY